MKIDFDTCDVCGHKWIVGNNPSHSCTDRLLSRLAVKDKQLEFRLEELDRKQDELKQYIKIASEVYTNDFLQSVEEMVEEIYELTGNRYPDFLNKLNLIQSNEPK